MNAKKSLISLLALCLILSSLSACGEKNKTPNTPEQTTDAPVDTTPVIIEDEGVDFWAKSNAGFDSATEGAAADFEIESANGKVTILSYKGSQEHLIVPEAIDGQPLTSIADGAFAENVMLKTLVLPEIITNIGKGILAG